MAPTTKGLGALFGVLVFALMPAISVPPWIVLGGHAYVFDYPKLLVAVAAALIAWAALLAHLRATSLAHVASLVFWAGIGRWALIPIAAVFISSILGGGDWARILLGTDERMDGAVATVLMLHLAQVGSALVRVRIISWTSVVDLALVGGALASAEIIGQSVGIHPWTLVDGLTANGAVPAGAFGHPGLASIFLASIFVLVLGDLAGRPRAKNPARWAGLVLISIGLAIPAGRAGVVAGVLACVLLLLVPLVDRSQRRRRIGLALAGGCLLLVSVLLIPNLNQFSAERVARFAATVEADRGAVADRVDLSTRLRFVTWSVAPSVIGLSPLYGSGSGAFSEHMWNYLGPDRERLILSTIVPAALLDHAVRVENVVVAVNPDDGTVFSQIVNYDKVHNYFLDLAVQFGLLGVIGFLVFWSRIGWTSIHHLNDRAGYLALTLCYLAAQQFWFATPSIDIGILALIGCGYPASDHGFGRVKVGRKLTHPTGRLNLDPP